MSGGTKSGRPLISFTSTLQIHEYQTIRASRQARDASQAEAVKEPDPSVLDMIKAIQPLIGPLQDEA